jgi:HK97 family phage prohead protease
MSKRELRFAGVDLRAVSSDGKMTIKGRPAIYGSLSKDLGGFREVLLRGCFDESLDDPDLYATFNHNDSAIIGRASAGTLQVGSDNIGLTMRCELPNNTLGRDLYESIQRGDISKMSFGMFVSDDDWDVDQDAGGRKFERRSIRKAKLFEVSAVTSPAYEASSVSARSLFPDGTPVSVELRSKRAASVVGVDDRTLAAMRAALELRKRQ